MNDDLEAPINHNTQRLMNENHVQVASDSTAVVNGVQCSNCGSAAQPLSPCLPGQSVCHTCLRHLQQQFQDSNIGGAEPMIYEPELSEDDNPHYYNINKLLFDAHVSRTHRK